MIHILGPGVTDDEAEEGDIPLAAPAAYGGGFALNNNDNNNNNNQIQQPAPSPYNQQSSYIQQNPQQKIKKATKSKKGKRLYFWQKVMRKEEELMNEFASKRPKDEYFHITHGQYGMSNKKDNDNNNNVAFGADMKMNNDDEDEYEWKEPDFDELLSKPIPKYRWGIQYNYDLQIDEPKTYTSNREYLMIDDRVKRGKDFTIDEKIGNYKSDFGIVLKVEQWDDTRLDKDKVRGDKIYLTWSSFRPFRFNYNGAYDIEFFKRGQVFALDYSHIRIGDRVSRGFSWTDDMYKDINGHPEDGGQGSKGTVVAIQYVLQVTGIIAKVRWHKNGHINLYSWGFKKVYDLRRIQ